MIALVAIQSAADQFATLREGLDTFLSRNLPLNRLDHEAVSCPPGLLRKPRHSFLEIVWELERRSRHS